MSKTLAIIGSIVGGLAVLFFVLVTISGFSYNFHPLYSSCLDLSVGMNKEEVNTQMELFTNNPNYKVSNGDSGQYGWGNRLSYDESVLIVLDKEPWYKLDQHPWRCGILFKNGLVVEIQPFFD